jgi:hypothetical protein
LDFVQNYDKAHVYKKVSGRSIPFLILDVDGILLIGNNIELLNNVYIYLNKSLSMKYLGKAAYILGINIYRDRLRCPIGLSQSAYLDKV